MERNHFLNEEKLEQPLAHPLKLKIKEKRQEDLEENQACPAVYDKGKRVCHCSDKIPKPEPVRVPDLETALLEDMANKK